MTGRRRPARAFDPGAVRFGADGLVPGVVQDAADGRVLMVGYLDAEALAATLATGEVHFHSRSRDRLWRKGETSGNVLRLRGARGRLRRRRAAPPGRAGRADLPPRHAELLRRGRRRAGPDARSPPAPTSADQGFAWLETLWTTIAERAADRPAGSYTARLLDGGVDAAGRKVTEEATEVLLAAKDDAAAEATGDDRGPTREALAGETADLLYHALVLLAERGLEPAAVLDVLRGRRAPARCAGRRCAQSGSTRTIRYVFFPLRRTR